MTDPTLDQLEVFHGQASASMARVYARLNLEIGQSRDNRQWKLIGHVHGPHSSIATTLPFHVPLKPISERSEGQSSIISEAHVIDPCFWSPDSPSLYTMKIALQDGQRTVDQRTRWFGIRNFGTRGPDLILDGKRWVIRAAARRSVSKVPIQAWREHRMAMWVDEIDVKLFAEASEAGVMLIVHLKVDSDRIRSCLKCLCHWACAAMVVVDATDEISVVSRLAPNTILLQPTSGSSDLPLAPWADGVIWNVNDEPCFARDWRVPIVAVRDSTNHADLATARLACDRLQRDLATQGQCAGYIVA